MKRATFGPSDVDGAAKKEQLTSGTLDEDGVEAPLVADFREKLLKEIDLTELSKLDLTQRRARLERVMTYLVANEGPLLSSRERSSLIKRVVADTLGLGVLEPLITDDAVTEIMVNGHDQIFVERFGTIELTSKRFASPEQLMQTIDRIVSQVNRRVDESSPMVDARLPNGERVNVVLPPLALDGPTMTIRKFPEPFSMDELVARHAIDEHTAALLGVFVRAELNIVVSGGTGSGKTTLLNALSAFIPDDERIVTIEDSAELSLAQRHVIRLESRPANVEGRGAVSIRDLVRNSLRMRPDRIVVGEVRGGETMDMLTAMNTGHEGSLTTVHANSPGDALSRLETLATMSDLDIPFHALTEQVNNAVDVLVQLERSTGGQRRVREVSMLVSRRREDYDLQPVAVLRRGPASEGPARGDYEHFPLPAKTPDRLLDRSGEIPDVFRPRG